ncbi:hypothetical protein D3C76_1469450 [compost metagenome]
MRRLPAVNRVSLQAFGVAVNSTLAAGGLVGASGWDRSILMGAMGMPVLAESPTNAMNSRRNWP